MESQEGWAFTVEMVSSATYGVEVTGKVAYPAHRGPARKRDADALVRVTCATMPETLASPAGPDDPTAGSAPRAWLRVRTVATEVRLVEQVDPVVAGLTSLGVAGLAEGRYQARDYPAVGWSCGERRDYHLVLGPHHFTCDGPLYPTRIEMVTASPGGLQACSEVGEVLTLCGKCDPDGTCEFALS